MKKRIILVIVVLFVIGLLGWRFLGNSYDSIVENRDDIDKLSVDMMVSGSAVTEPDIDSYELESKSSEESMKKVLKILKTSKYQNDWRNLLPWDVSSISGGKSKEDALIVLRFTYGTKGEIFKVKFLGEKIVIVDRRDGAKDRIYHPTNEEAVSELVKYIKKHGKKKDK